MGLRIYPYLGLDELRPERVIVLIRHTAEYMQLKQKAWFDSRWDAQKQSQPALTSLRQLCGQHRLIIVEPWPNFPDELGKDPRDLVRDFTFCLAPHIGGAGAGAIPLVGELAVVLPSQDQIPTALREVWAQHMQDGNRDYVGYADWPPPPRRLWV